MPVYLLPASGCKEAILQIFLMAFKKLQGNLSAIQNLFPAWTS